ncbi:d-aminoacid aminotransferase-like plp-dependent enzymes superfamily protein [Anaeramoeba ignava]|uniref:D-aminoacid aminotransferase-like plp-dependent enzymes superfamily protein n=1 Tax=Anaeramoeba ignava TaxID=1746090 RepID=A0A9Q0LD46_ANAIG|nr:d-aminoacid aminotransferase-like plp-dependent enzymes superfamily protein [Anaeramoeba ignava]
MNENDKENKEKFEGFYTLNGETKFTTKSLPLDFLVEFPRGVYTVTRTINKNRALNFEVHVKRLFDSAKKCPVFEDSKFLTFLNDFEPFYSLVIQNVEKTYTELRKYFPKFNDDTRITLYLTSKDLLPNEKNYIQNNFVLIIHLAKFTSYGSPPIVVEVRGNPRSNPTAKDTNWLKKKKELAKDKHKKAIETLLVDENGLITEASSSNFFVVQGNTLYTAPDEQVLNGSIRALVIKVCEEKKIPIIFANPKTSEISIWDGAFLTGTSRLVQQIDEIYMFDKKDKNMKHFSFKSSDLIKEIESIVKQKLVECSVILNI